MASAETFMDYIEALKRNIEAISSLLETGAEILGKDPNELANKFRGELVVYMANIAAADGKIDENEVLLINALNTLGTVSIDKDGLDQMVTNKKLPNPLLFEVVPPTFAVFCTCDKLLKENGKKSGIVNNVIDMYTRIFAMMSVIDGDSSETEKDACNTFLKTLIDFSEQF